MHEKCDFSTLYPVQNCEDINGDRAIQDYIVGGLCRGLSGFIETTYIYFAITGDKTTLLPKVKVKDIPINIQNFVNRNTKKKQRSGEMEKNAVGEYNTLDIRHRHQAYNSSFRCSEGESVVR